MSEEISTFPEVAHLLSITPIRVSASENKYPCPYCGTMNVQANDLFGRCWHCYDDNSKFNYISYYAAMTGLSTSEATKEISQKVGRNAGSFIKIEIKKEKDPLAPVEELDKTYRALLSQLGISKRHIQDLKKRGLSDADISRLSYRTYDMSYKSDRERLAKKVLDKGCTVKQVPGFYNDPKTKNLTFCWRKTGILVPYKNRNGFIQGFQLRKNDELLEKYWDGKKWKKENKYDWISSKDTPKSPKPNGTSSRTFTHYACDFYYDFNLGQDKPILTNEVLLTEGAMKADIIHAFTHLPCMAVPGVQALEEFEAELGFLKDEGVETIISAFDMDYIKNEQVKKGCERLKNIIESNGFNYKRASWNPEYKGYDDYLNATISPIV